MIYVLANKVGVLVSWVCHLSLVCGHQLWFPGHATCLPEVDPAHRVVSA